MSGIVGIYVPFDAAGPGVVRRLRAFWEGDGPQAAEQVASVRPRDLRFVSADGRLVGEPWHRLVAELLNGRLAPDLAPCVRAIEPKEVRSLHRSEVRWSDLDERGWRALRSMGLSREAEAALAASPEDTREDAPSRPVGRAPIDRATLLPALHAALGTWPADDIEGRALAEALRDHLRADALRRIEGLSWRAAAAALGVSLSVLQRWREPGGPLAP